jgi:hypothetical protein
MQKKRQAPAKGHPPILLAFPKPIIYPSGTSGRSLGHLGHIGEPIIFIAVFLSGDTFAASVANMAHRGAGIRGAGCDRPGVKTGR